jgi:hypothetical protein
LPEELDRTRNQVWAQMQQELSHLSTNGTLVIAKGSGHDIQNQRPEIVIEAVHNVVDRAREKSAAPERDRDQTRSRLWKLAFCRFPTSENPCFSGVDPMAQCIRNASGLKGGFK